MGDGVPDLTETTNMDSMFYGANLFTDGTAFGGWDVSGVTNMKRMFKETIVNGGGLGNWDVSGVTDMESMFHGAPSLTEGLGDWDVSGSTNMAAMFRNATTFTGAGRDDSPTLPILSIESAFRSRARDAAAATATGRDPDLLSIFKHEL